MEHWPGFECYWSYKQNRNWSRCWRLCQQLGFYFAKVSRGYQRVPILANLYPCVQWNVPKEKHGSTPPPSPLRNAEPHLMSTPRPGPSSVPTDHGDQSCIPNWGPPLLISLSGQECMGSEHPQLSVVGLTEKAMQMRCCLRGRFLLRTCKLWNFVHRKQYSFFMSSCIQFVYLFDTSFCFVSFCLS